MRTNESGRITIKLHERNHATTPSKRTIAPVPVPVPFPVVKSTNRATKPDIPDQPYSESPEHPQSDISQEIEADDDAMNLLQALRRPSPQEPAFRREEREPWQGQKTEEEGTAPFEPNRAPFQDPYHERAFPYGSIPSAKMGRASLFGEGEQRTRRPFWKKPGMKLFLSITGAVIVGLQFGFLVLAVFMNEQVSHSYNSVLGKTVQTLTAAENAGADGHGEPSGALLADGKASNATAPEATAASAAESALAGAEGVVTVSIPEQSFFIAQGGVFSDQKSAEAAAASLDSKKLPHMLLEADNKHYLYLASATSRDHILGLASQLKGAGMEVYVKEIKLSGVQQELVSQPPQASQASQNGGGAAADNLTLNSGFKLVGMLADWSGQTMRDGKTVKLAAEADAQLRELHRRFLEEGRAVEALIPESAKPAFSRMVNGVNMAVTAYSQAKDSNVESYAWQAQKGVLQFMEGYMLWSKQM